MVSSNNHRLEKTRKSTGTKERKKTEEKPKEKRFFNDFLKKETEEDFTISN